MKQVSSPLVKGGKTKKCFSLDRNLLVNSYSTELGVDISSHLPKTFDESAGLYECTETGYLFFYPSSLEGDGAFYKHITSNDSYYNDVRWEWNDLIDKISINEKVLEIGAGGLAFMKMLADKGVDVEGLEINPLSFAKATELGLKLHAQTIQEFSVNNKGKYDVVCTFHVLEHIADVYSFLESAIQVLKPGGRLIISVPNNDSFIKLDKFLALNLPPHHMGRWTEKALRSLGSIFSLKIESVLKQEYDTKYNSWHYGCWYRGIGNNFGIAGKVYGKLIKPLFLWNLNRLRNQIIGPNIMVIFTKK